MHKWRHAWHGLRRHLPERQQIVEAIGRSHRRLSAGGKLLEGRAVADLEQPVLTLQHGDLFGQRLLFLLNGAELMEQVVQRTNLGLLLGGRGFQTRQPRRRDLRRDFGQKRALSGILRAQALHDVVERAKLDLVRMDGGVECAELELLSMQRRVDSVEIEEYANLSRRDSPHLLFELMGFGRPPDSFDSARSSYLLAEFGPPLAALADENRVYSKKFGYVFLICATGKSSEEILAALRQRLPNAPEIEMKTAAEEQRKITRLRLQKLLVS